MTRNSDFKRLVRKRMAETGESYAVARSHFAVQPTDARTPRPAGPTVAGFAKVYERVATDDLAPRLEKRYGARVSGVTQLDLGVFRVDRSGQPSWVARVFPAARSFEAAAGDAEILAYLEAQDFPAERLADAEPVFDLAQQPVLVTRWVDGTNQRARKREEMIASLGRMLGRLHGLPPGGGACVRPAGSWHHLSVNGGSRRDDVEILIALVRDKQTRTPRDERPLLDELCAELASLDELEDLPMTLTHPDPCRANLVADDAGDGVLVDWTGAGRGPRVGSFAALVWSLTSFAHIDAAVAGYREHSSLDDRELGRLEGALVGFPAVLLAWGLLFREQLSVGDVLHTMSTQRERAARIADHVRSAWTAPVHAEAAPVGRQESLF